PETNLLPGSRPFCYRFCGSPALYSSGQTSDLFQPSGNFREATMNNKKCSFCGFINFVSAETCKKCEAMLVSASEAPQAGETYYGQPAQRYAPGRVTPYSSKSRFPILKGVAYVFAGLVVLSALSGGGVALLKSRSKVTWREYHPDGS